MQYSKYELDVNDVLCLFLIYQGVMFATILIVSKLGTRLFNRVLILFCTIFSLNFLNILLLRTNSTFFSTNLGIVFGFLYGPLLLLYMESLSQKAKQWSKSHSVHLLPACSVLVLILLGAVPTASVYLLVFSFLIVIHILGYLTFIYFRIRKYQKNLLQVLSRLEGINLAWLKNIITSILIITLLAGIESFVQWRFLYAFDEAMQTIIFSFSLFMLNSLYFKGLKHPIIYTGAEQDDRKSNVPKILKEEVITLKQQLLTHIHKEKPHLNFDLSLDQLALSSGIPPRILSVLLNQYLGQTFFEFINKLRVEEAKNRMLEKPDLQVKEIMFDSGFSSKSTFNDIFKKFESKTPTQFKKEVKSKTENTKSD